MRGALLCALLAASPGCRLAEDVRPANQLPEALTESPERPGLRLRGSTADGVASHLGIPFARPPVGDLRWAPPIPAAAWAEERDATEPGPACPQPAGALASGRVEWDEDCLTLNVWAPEEADGLPVMVWIHGGGLLRGSSSTPTYDGAKLAARGVVVVTVNYRLGALGYLAHEPFAAEHPDHLAAGNYGLLDQVMALWWVQERIAGFGGDPGRVTVFGESAGGLSVCALLASPLAEGLFHRAIVQSGGCPRRIAAADGSIGAGPDAFAQGARFANAAGCDADEAACLRGLSAAEVLETLPGRISLDLRRDGERYGLVSDGLSLPAPPMAALASGSAHAVPLMVGSNSDEGWLFTRALPDGPLTEAALGRLGADPDAVWSLYPTAAHGGPRAAFSAALGDASFVCPARAIARAHARAGNETWLYHFAYAAPRAREQGMGAIHGAEISYVFGNFALPGALLRPEQEALHEEMASRWVAFAATGSPALSDDDEWQPYDQATDLALLLDAEGGRTVARLKGKECDFWDARLEPAP